MSYGLQMSSSFAAGTAGGRYAELSVSSAVTELTLCDEFHFNNNGPFIIRPVIFTVVVYTQCGQNARQGQRCKENRGI
jgi:hypothetical protein